MNNEPRRETGLDARAEIHKVSGGSLKGTRMYLMALERELENWLRAIRFELEERIRMEGEPDDVA